MAKIQRESNMELLRIIAMLMITFHHFLIHKYRGSILYGDDLIDGWQIATIINGFVYIGVNVFVLISGYFGIKFKWKGVLNLFIFCAFYMMLSLVGQNYSGKIDISFSEIIIRSLTATTRTTKWFIPCYLALYFLSPLLNLSRDNLNKRQYIYALLILSVYCLWFGYIRQVAVFNNNGYTVGQFIWLYFIGGYIRRFNIIDNCKRYRFVCLSVWSVLCALWGGATILLHSGISVPLWHPTTYNNPFTLGGSIAFFCFFTTIHFHSRAINHIAQSVLAVYLYSVSIPWLIPVQEIINPDRGIWYYLLFATIVVTRKFVIVVGIDQIRLLLMLPINWLWDKMNMLFTRMVHI